jgi:hypothetical protein
MPRPASRPFREAVKDLAGKKILPTSLDSAGISQLDASVRRTSFTSAKTTIEGLLDRYKAQIQKMVEPVQVARPDRVTLTNPEGLTTEGINQPTARLEIKKLLQSMDYQPEDGQAGTIQDLSSDARINLVLKTNRELAQGAGHFIQGNDPDVIDAFPCWELVRFEERKMERDWKTRWKIAAQVANDVQAARVAEETDRMIARKDSEIWQALGDGAGGYQDTLGNPYPPFAFNSGMWIQDVSRREAQELGLITPGETPTPKVLDLGEIFNLGEAA